MSKRLAILISGRGSNMESILAAAKSESWDAEFCLVLSNKPDAAGLKTAAAAGIPTRVLDHREYRGRRPDYDTDLATILQAERVDLVVLAGFMRILGVNFTTPFAQRALNIHPSLLPLYPGLNTHQRALDAGDSKAGCTIHFIDETLDGGEIVAQAEVPIFKDDDASTLAARVLIEEHKLYPRVVRDWLDGKLNPTSNPTTSARAQEARS